VIVFIWLLNFAISWFNAWGCGKTWNETKHSAGGAHLMNWMGAIMSASGFTWCYLVIACFLGGTIPVEQDDGTTATWLTMEQVQVVADLGYLVIIGPILGSGLAITVHTWGVFYRRRTIGNAALGGYNTFANIYNIHSALSYVPTAGSRVFDFFSGGGSKSSSSNGKGKVLLLVVLAAAAGILTTYIIIKRTAKATAINRAHRYEWKEMMEGSSERRVRI
jgi:hypothetical protein